MAASSETGNSKHTIGGLGPCSIAIFARPLSHASAAAHPPGESEDEATPEWIAERAAQGDLVVGGRRHHAHRPGIEMTQAAESLQAARGSGRRRHHLAADQRHLAGGMHQPARDLGALGQGEMQSRQKLHLLASTT